MMERPERAAADDAPVPSWRRAQVTVHVRKDTAFVLKKDRFGMVYLQSPKSGVHKCVPALVLHVTAGSPGARARAHTRAMPSIYPHSCYFVAFHDVHCRYVLDASTGDFVDESDKHNLLEVRRCFFKKECVCTRMCAHGVAIRAQLLARDVMTYCHGFPTF